MKKRICTILMAAALALSTGCSVLTSGPNPKPPARSVFELETRKSEAADEPSVRESAEPVQALSSVVDLAPEECILLREEQEPCSSPSGAHQEGSSPGQDDASADSQNVWRKTYILSLVDYSSVSRSAPGTSDADGRDVCAGGIPLALENQDSGNLLSTLPADILREYVRNARSEGSAVELLLILQTDEHGNLPEGAATDVPGAEPSAGN